MASCSFTSTTHHISNTASPWEYDEPLQSTISLDSETAGYNLVPDSIEYGDHFDKACLCDSFNLDTNS
jgi:hypothetical protein